MRYELQRHFTDCPVMPWARVKTYEDDRLKEAKSDFRLLKKCNDDRRYRVVDLVSGKVIKESK